MNYEVRFTKYDFSVRRLRRRDKMRKVFTGLFVVTLVLVFCCPLMGGETQPGFVGTESRSVYAEARPSETPGLGEDSGLTWYQVAGVLALLGGGGALGWTGCKKMQAIRLEPQPLEVQMSKDYVPRSEFEEYRKQVASDIERIHKRLDTVMPAVAEIKGELKQIAQKQTQILNLLLNGKASA